MVFNNVGDYCKWLEKNFSNEIMIPKLPIIIRLDGNNFSNWTRGLNRPFDSKLSELMIRTTEHLVKHTNAIIGYTQSDEITLILYSDNLKTLPYNGGKKYKILSKLASECTNYFNETRRILIPEHNKTAVFDCRIYQTPTLEDATLQLLWRENDAVKNSISMLAQSMFSHKDLHGLSGKEKQDKMFKERNINWNDLEDKFKRGTYIKSKIEITAFSKEELDRLPPKHIAHLNPDFTFERSVIKRLDIPIFNKIKNKVGFVFFNEEPETI